MRGLAKMILRFYSKNTVNRLVASFIIFISTLSALADSYDADRLNQAISSLFSFALTIFMIYGFYKIVTRTSFSTKKSVLRKNMTIVQIDKMNGVQFEKFLIELFRSKGYKAWGTPATGDFGADLILETIGEKIAVQAKCYSGSVGVSAVQEAISGKAYYKCNRAMVITNSKFTKKAWELAKSARVELWDRDKLTREIKGFEMEVEEQPEMIT